MAATAAGAAARAKREVHAAEQLFSPIVDRGAGRAGAAGARAAAQAAGAYFGPLRGPGAESGPAASGRQLTAFAAREIRRAQQLRKSTDNDEFWALSDDGSEA